MISGWSGCLCLLGDDALNVGNALIQDLLKDLGVLELLVDLGNDALGELTLLPLLDLALVADPGVQDGLGLVGNGRLLLELVSLGLELGGFLGDLEEGLGDVNDTAEVLDALDALLDGLVWSARAALRMPLILSTWLWA